MHRIHASVIAYTNNRRFESDKEENKPELWFSLFEVLQLRKEQLRSPLYSSSRSHPSCPVPVATWSRARTGSVFLVYLELRSKIKNGLLPLLMWTLGFSWFWSRDRRKVGYSPPPFPLPPLQPSASVLYSRSCESLNSSQPLLSFNSKNSLLFPPFAKNILRIFLV